MILEFILTREDYLVHQLFVASKKESVKKQRVKSIIYISITFFIIGVLFLKNENKYFSYYFFGIGLLCALFYRKYQKQKYQKYYEKYIDETYKNRFNQEAKVNFEETIIDIKDLTGETKIKYTVLEEINEIENYIFLKLKTGGDLIIPKLKIKNLVDFKIRLQDIAEKYSLKQNIELDWRWK